MSLQVYASYDSPRLRYVMDWILVQRLGTTYQLQVGNSVPAHPLPGLALGILLPDCIYIPDAGLLLSGASDQSLLAPEKWTRATEGEGFEFDLFSAVFFLLTRMEEYGSPAKDKHDRYPHTESILHKINCLDRPLVDEWIEKLRLLLNEKLNAGLAKKPFSFQPSYDVDIAWSYLHKGFKRSVGGLLRDLFGLHFRAVAQRILTGAGFRQDAYDAFAVMKALHQATGLRPLYFILAALQDSPFDKNIPPAHPAMQRLIKELASEGTVAMHPSYYSQIAEEIFASEKIELEKWSGEHIDSSRQHYIRYNMPATPRFLLSQGIAKDFSMGYATTMGFRAGTSQAFYFYDLEAETETKLLIHPFCFMDSTAHYDQGLSVEESFLRLRQIRALLMAQGGCLITVFHNFSLGTEPEWKGWWEAYADFVSETADLARAQ